MTTGFKQGDLEPPLILDITGPGGDLNAVESWRILGRMRGAADLKFDATPSVEVDPDDATKAVVTHEWAEGDTDTLGLLLVEVEALWPGGRRQTFPTEGYVQIRISDDLD